MDYTLALQKALVYIEENLENEITLESVASKSGYSLFHFHRLFQGANGETVMEYIRRKRILYAAKDLLGSDTTIVDVALKYGFESHDVFTRTFRRFLGITPSKYRIINGCTIPLYNNIPKEEIKMYDSAIYDRMSCSIEEKRQCIPLIEFILKLSEKARKNGLLALEGSAEDQVFFFHKALDLVLGGVEPISIRNIMMNYILTGNYQGVNLLKRVLILEGLLAIQASEHPMLLSEKLLSYLGEELAWEVENRVLQPYSLQDQFLNDFIENIKSKKPMSSSTAILEDPIAMLDNRSLQRSLRDVTIEDIICALKGASGNIVTKVLECLPVKTKTTVINELDITGTTDPKCIIEAQNRIIETILKLRANGEIRM